MNWHCRLYRGSQYVLPKGELTLQQYIYRISPVRTEMILEPSDQEAIIIGQHFHYLQELTESGQAILVGRTLTADAHSFGLVIFDAESEAAADKLMNNDPAVSAKVMNAQLFPFKVVLQREEPAS